MTNGVEWNYRLNSNQNQADFDEFYKTFENLFNNHSVVIDDEQLKEYAKNWHRPAVAKDLEKLDPFTEEDTLVFKTCEPRGV